MSYDISLSGLLHLVWHSLGPHMLLQMALFSSFSWLNNIPLFIHTCIHIYIYIYPPHLLYPFLCWWTFRLFPHLGYYKQCYSEHLGGCMCIFGPCFSLDICSGVWLQGHKVTIFRFLGNLHTILHTGSATLHSHQQCRRFGDSLIKVIKVKSGDMGETWSNMTSVLIVRDKHTQKKEITWRHREKIAIYKPMRETLRRNQPCWHLDIGILVSRTVRK